MRHVLRATRPRSATPPVREATRRRPPPAAAAALLLALLARAVAAAHDFRPAVLVLDVDPAGRVDGRLDLPPGAAALTLELPACRPLPAAPTRLRADCGPDGLRGQLRVGGEHDELVVHLRRAGAAPETMVLGPGDDVLDLSPAPALPPGYFALGVAHIAGGADHLLFVAGLALLVRPALRLAAALTAFTAAHSLTLALAALDLVRVPQAPVEACIALSLVLLARELALARRPTAAAAWRFAGACGLLHGLGFAGALADIGLPDGALVPALLAFNAGVELGQLGAAGLVLALAALARAALPRAPRSLAALPALALGAIASAWTLERTLALWTAP